MKLSDFDYNLPHDLIASEAVSPRDQSRLLVLNRQEKTIEHDRFFNLTNHLQSGDVLVINSSKVFPARLIGKKERTGGKVEILLNKEVEPGVWEVVGRGLRVGMRVIFDNSFLQAGVESKEGNTYAVRFNLSGKNFFNELEKIGNIPLPPYIVKRRRETENQGVGSESHLEESVPHMMRDELEQTPSRWCRDKEDYQTVYAKDVGSAAAPTAGLHFTPKLLEKVKAIGVEVVEVTLHVGLGTFAPVKEEDVLRHKIHSEYFSVSKEALGKIIRAKKENRRVVAVGTTTTRVLEHVFSDPLIRDTGYVSCDISGWTNIYIYPGYKFKAVDAMITNFHVPKSSLLILVSAFAGRDLIMKSYEEAIKEKYRFYSYGDAMLIS